ncbi:MAG: ketopantoate reductase family protein [Lachnospiraceae bacterium]|nr:ketopantoate reductase family protein [Lachnospiraceae bacterium]
MKEIKTVSLIGLGAIGAFVAPKLQEKLGDNFRVIAGGSRKKRLEKQGVIINDISYKFPIVEPEEKTGYADFAIFAVKNTQLSQAIVDMKNQIGPDTIVMSLLNGVTSEIHIGQAFYPENILTSVIRVPSLNQNGKISYPESSGMISFGEEKNDKLSPRVEAVKRLFDKAQIRYQIPNDMLKNMWLKYMSNVSENQLCAILGVPYKGFAVSLDHIEYMRENAAREVIAIAQKKGINLSEQDLVDRIPIVRGLIPDGKPSTLQDIEAGRKTEVETFAGDVIRMGQEIGVATPYNEIFYHMIYALEEKNEGKFS